jgi:hypothetical protein
MKKMKITIVTGMLAASAFSLTGCITTMPMGMPGMMPGGMAASSPTGGAQQGGAPASSGGANWAGRGLFGNGGVMGISAEKFATNVHSLEINKSTPEDAIVLLGAPMMRHKDGQTETLSYTLFSNNVHQGAATLTFTQNKLQYIVATKQSIGAGINSETIFEKGKKPKVQ